VHRILSRRRSGSRPVDGTTLALAVAGALGAVTAAVLVGLLHVIPPSAHLSPVRRTISEYALLDTGWVFDLAVAALSVGAGATLVALVRARLVPATSGGAVVLVLYGVSLPLVAVFPKHDWSVGPSVHGDIHRAVSLVVFLSLPFGAMLVARAWLAGGRWRRHAWGSLGLGVLSLLCLSPIIVAIVLEPYTGVRWWRAIPLGAVERLVALSQVGTVLMLAWWAARGAAAARAPVPR